MEYLLWNNDYKNIPVTENYIKNNSLSLYDKYGLTNYTDIMMDFDIDNDIVILNCGIYDEPDDEFILIKNDFINIF